MLHVTYTRLDPINEELIFQSKHTPRSSEWLSSLLSRVETDSILGIARIGVCMEDSLNPYSCMLE